MKKFYFLIILLTGVIMLSAQNRPVISKSPNHRKTYHARSFELPFNENWSSGSFETNNWTKECDNWTINNHQGNDSPCAEFTWDPLMQNGYSCSLTSDTLRGDLFDVGKILLRFEVKLDNRYSTGEEKLTVEVSDSSNWIPVAEFINDNSFGWTKSQVDITEITIGKKFQIRFNASGQNSFNIISWFIDNIFIYRTCDPPEDLEGEPMYLNDLYVHIEWVAPVSTQITDSTWLHWDSGSNYWGIGVSESNADFSVAMRYDSGQLSDYDGDTIGEEKFFLFDEGFSQIVAKIWTGSNASSLIYSDTLENPVAGAWNTISLDTVIVIDADKEYWVGYTILGQPLGYFPAGIDAGPAVAGYGDMVSTDGVTWLKLSDMGLNYNFNIQLMVYDHEQPFLYCTGFNLYRQKVNDTAYEMYKFIPFVEGTEKYSYDDYDISEYITVCYKVNAKWGLDGDTCLSPFAKAKLMPIDNYVCINLTESINENNRYDIIIHPNPVLSALVIQSEEDISGLTIYNNMGQPVMSVESLDTKNHELDVLKLPPGVYIIHIETKHHFAVRKFLKLR